MLMHVSNSSPSLLGKINLREGSDFQEKASNVNSGTSEVVALICNNNLNGFRLMRTQSIPGLVLNRLQLYSKTQGKKGGCSWEESVHACNLATQ